MKSLHNLAKNTASGPSRCGLKRWPVLFELLLIVFLFCATGYCSETVKVSTKAELLELLLNLEWVSQGPYSSGPAPITSDVEIMVPIRIASSDMPVPASCQRRNDCKHALSFGHSRPVRGLLCEKTGRFRRGDSCDEISLSPGRYRFRGIMVDMHPSKYNFMPFVEVYPPSEEPCREGEFSCAKDHTCQSSFNGYCRFCLGRSVDECACRKPDGIVPDGTKCHFFISGDLMAAGVCRKGVCIRRK